MQHREDDLSFLVDQTMDHAANSEGIDPFFDEGQDLLQSLDEGPGVLYRVQKSFQHLCLRMVPVRSVKESLEIYQDNKQLFPDLNKGELHELGPIEFFSTQYLEAADVLCETLANQRFTLFEDRFDAINDTSINWWLVENKNAVEIYYRYPRRVKEGEILHLGPLGDNLVFSFRLAKSKELLNSLFPVSTLYADEDRFFINVKKGAFDENQAQKFEQFLNIFKYGQMNDEFLKLIAKERSLALYFQELATIRKFWNQLVEKGHYPSLYE